MSIAAGKTRYGGSRELRIARLVALDKVFILTTFHLEQWATAKKTEYPAVVVLHKSATHSILK